MKKKIWIITDTHLGHDNMVAYCGRPINHSDLILENLRNTIRSGDVFIHLGDICFGDDENWHKALMCRIPIGVKKILIKGNHDKKSNHWYLEHGWDFVCESMSDHFYGKYITFSHQPIPNIQNLNIHGHFHNNLERLKRKEFVVADEEERNKEVLAGLNGNHKLLALELTNYMPITLNSLLQGE